MMRYTATLCEGGRSGGGELRNQIRIRVAKLGIRVENFEIWGLEKRKKMQI